jgi:hypothetical protein
LTISTSVAPTTYSFSFADAWAKTTDGQVSVHLLTHCRIAGAVARVLALRDQYSWTSGLPILCASHDVGKMSAPFLSQCPSWMSDHGLAQLIDRWRLSKIRHEVFSQVTISDILDERGQGRVRSGVLLKQNPKVQQTNAEYRYPSIQHHRLACQKHSFEIDVWFLTAFLGWTGDQPWAAKMDAIE